MKLIEYRRPAEANRPVTQKDVDEGAILVSVGGDGTFLEAVRSLKGLPMPIVGVNTGRLGFLASVSPEDRAEMEAELAAGNYTVQKRTMLTAAGDFGTTPDRDKKPDFPCALNEFSIHRHTADMVEVAVRIDGQMVAAVRGDGLIVSTPTGSTAYSLSAGGPIVAPDCRCFVLSAIAPHNFSVRPLVVTDDSAIELAVHTRGGEAIASLDNVSWPVADGARFTIKKAACEAFFVALHNISFYDTLRDRMMWGLDKRDKNATFGG